MLEEVEGIDRFSGSEHASEDFEIACIATKTMKCKPGFSFPGVLGSDFLEFQVKGAICKDFTTQ